jgi:plastocyanin
VKRESILAAAVICLLGGTLVSCQKTSVSLSYGTEFPHANKGDTIEWDSFDGQTYNITFTGLHSPCKEGKALQAVPTLSGKPAKPAVCTVVGADGTYPYTIAADNSTGKNVRAPVPMYLSVGPCHACGGIVIELPGGDPSRPRDLSPQFITLGIDGQGNPTISPTPPTKVVPGQVVAWQSDGGYNGWTVSFTGGTTPCVQGALFYEDKDPRACTISPSASGDYPYDFTVHDESSTGKGKLTVAASTP